MVQWDNCLQNSSFIKIRRGMPLFSVIYFGNPTPSATGPYGRLAGWLAVRQIKVYWSLIVVKNLCSVDNVSL